MGRKTNKVQELIECACGCGRTLRKYDSRWRPRRFIYGHYMRVTSPTFEHLKNTQFGNLENHPRWKGGRYITTDGYIKIKKRDHPFADCSGYVMEHRLVMEKKLWRYLEPQERVHHINGKRDDNRRENLNVYDNIGFHVAVHRKTKNI